mmetsp:Transcript_6583/g.20377  ORF Transcript_6583/g.20377 Transcript_6583/m.20377 type:complete len:347 (+) Transcript_6583:1050-2090(+)
MGEVAAVRQVQAHDAVVHVAEGRVDVEVRRGAAQGLDVHAPLLWVQAAGVQRALHAEGLCLVDEFVPPVVARARVALRVLVHHDRAHREARPRVPVEQPRLLGVVREVQAIKVVHAAPILRGVRLRVHGHAPDAVHGADAVLGPEVAVHVDVHAGVRDCAVELVRGADLRVLVVQGPHDHLDPHGQGLAAPGRAAQGRTRDDHRWADRPHPLRLLQPVPALVLVGVELASPGGRRLDRVPRAVDVRVQHQLHEGRRLGSEPEKADRRVPAYIAQRVARGSPVVCRELPVALLALLPVAVAELQVRAHAASGRQARRLGQVQLCAAAAGRKAAAVGRRGIWAGQALG